MSIQIQAGIPVLTVFLQGLISFFSPCVLPLLPVYMGYLSGGTTGKDADGNTVYDRRKVLVNTLFFVIGISFAFFLLGFGISTIGRFFGTHQLLFARIGGIIVILFGLYQLGIFGTSLFLSRERRLPLDLSRMTVSPLTALLMGFVFSFAWTPCVGPTLSAVLLMAASSSSSAMGFLLTGVYTLGYVIPFLLLGFFTASLLDFFGKHRDIVKYTVKAGAVLMIFMGILMLSGKMSSISGYFASLSAKETYEEEIAEASEEPEDESMIADNSAYLLNENTDTTDITEETEALVEEQAASEAMAEEEEPAAEEQLAAEEEEPNAEEDPDRIAAPEFTLYDQYGAMHSLSDYRGKIVFLNFWATWCPPCRAELPDIQALYEEYKEMKDPEVVILGVVFPELGSEQDIDGITAFIKENQLTYPTLMDTEAELLYPYYISAFPTTFIIDPEGYVLGYIPGSMSKKTMKEVLSQAKELSGL